MSRKESWNAMAVRIRTEMIEEHGVMIAALREIVAEKSYKGFGDPADRLVYVTEIARTALARIDKENT